MIVKQRMQQEMAKNPDLLDGGIYHIDGKHCGILQSKSSSKICVVYISKDYDGGDNSSSTEFSCYENVADFLKNYPLDGSINGKNGAVKIS